jgi:hypothetical protein
VCASYFLKTSDDDYIFEEAKPHKRKDKPKKVPKSCVRFVAEVL